MELDDLKMLWKEADRRQEAMESALQFQTRLAVAGTRDRTRSSLGRVRLVLWYEVASATLAVLLAGSYVADTIYSLRFAVPGIALQLAAIATLGFAVYQLVVLGQVAYTGPVLTIQRDLAALQVVRARANRWLLLSAPLLWALLIIVVPHGLFGIDVYRMFGLPWVLANFVLGLAVLAVAAAASRAPAGGRVRAFLRAIGDDVTGRRLASASGFLDEIVEFDQAA